MIFNEIRKRFTLRQIIIAASALGGVAAVWGALFWFGQWHARGPIRADLIEQTAGYTTTDESGNRTYRCPEDYPSGAEYRESVSRFVDEVSAANPGITTEEIFAIRDHLMEAYDCSGRLDDDLFVARSDSRQEHMVVKLPEKTVPVSFNDKSISYVGTEYHLLESAGASATGVVVTSYGPELGIDPQIQTEALLLNWYIPDVWGSAGLTSMDVAEFFISKFPSDVYYVVGANSHKTGGDVILLAMITELGAGAGRVTLMKMADLNAIPYVISYGRAFENEGADVVLDMIVWLEENESDYMGELFALEPEWDWIDPVRAELEGLAN